MRMLGIETSCDETSAAVVTDTGGTWTIGSNIVASQVDLRGKDVLEVGCGTGLILKEVAREARRAMGVDLSGGMLRRSRERGLRVAQGLKLQLLDMVKGKDEKDAPEDPRHLRQRQQSQDRPR